MNHVKPIRSIEIEGLEGEDLAKASKHNHQFSPKVLAYKTVVGLRGAVDEDNFNKIMFLEPMTNTACNIGCLVMTGMEDPDENVKDRNERWFRVGYHLINVLINQNKVDLSRGDKKLIKKEDKTRDKYVLKAKDQDFMEDLLYSLDTERELKDVKIMTEPSYDPIEPYTDFWHESGGEMVRNTNLTWVRDINRENYPKVFSALNKHMENWYEIDQEMLEIYDQCQEDKIFTLEHKLLNKVQRESIQAQNRETMKRAKRTEGRPFQQHMFYDWRDRVYSSTIFINHGGNKISKSLYGFMAKDEIGAEGLYWTHVHAANCWGEDKTPIDDRHKFAKKKWKESWAEIAANPVKNKIWQDADSPFEFLRAIIELNRAKQLKDPTKYESGLMVAWDATCSGLQILSALARDEYSGEICNLTNSPIRGDYYKMISEEVWKHMEHTEKDKLVFTRITSELQELGDKINEAFESKGQGRKQRIEDAFQVRREYYKSHEQNIITSSKVFWSQDKVKALGRKVCKRPCMTYFYSCGWETMAKQMFKDLAPDEEFEGLTKFYCEWICELIYDTCQRLMPVPTKLMELFVDLGLDAAAKDKDFVLHAPYNNFKLVQSYREDETKQIKVKYRRKTIRPVVSVGQNNKLDKSKVKTGSSPNIVHMLDGQFVAYMINEKANDYILSTIHDSFSTTPANAGKLYEDLREGFIELFGERDLLREMLEQLGSEHYLENIPYGKLDISEISDNEYAFS